MPNPFSFAIFARNFIHWITTVATTSSIYIVINDILRG